MHRPEIPGSVHFLQSGYLCSVLLFYTRATSKELPRVNYSYGFFSNFTEERSLKFTGTIRISGKSSKSPRIRRYKIVAAICPMLVRSCATQVIGVCMLRNNGSSSNTTTERSSGISTPEVLASTRLPRATR